MEVNQPLFIKDTWYLATMCGSESVHVGSTKHTCKFMVKGSSTNTYISTDTDLGNP